jgi:CRP/FNR family transcriptional regulator
VSEEIWAALLAESALVNVRAGEFIYRTGQPARLAAIISGVVRIFTSSTGGRQVTMRYARPGDLIGLVSLLSGKESAGAEAVSDTSVAPLTLEHLRAVAARYSELSWVIAEQIADWVDAIVRTIVGASFGPMSVRVSRHLLDLAVRTAEGHVIAYTTHQALADAVGSAREVVTRVLGELRTLGVVETGPGRVLLLRPRTLARIAGGTEPRLAARGGL